ncbi:hypothetical protein [Nitrosococcus halophilus]|uniref:hypothetical protein n=1 Tax=Nitrosococcus halophilus TaxID=133539 RepID=UPI0002F76518|nr:hypothetical protein [Nitrosococcus halophilus]
MEKLQHTLAGVDTALEELPWETLFLAGKPFRQYRAQRGIQTMALLSPPQG